MSATVLIAADTPDHARHHAEQEGLEPAEWRYIATGQDVRGRRGAPVMVCNGFWRRPDANRVAAVMRYQQLAHVELEHNRDPRCGPVAGEPQP